MVGEVFNGVRTARGSEGVEVYTLSLLVDMGLGQVVAERLNDCVGFWVPKDIS